jgi:hypothetical protein
MRRYYEWVGEDVPVEKSGTEEELQAFEAENAQLTIVPQARYDTLAQKMELKRRMMRRIQSRPIERQLKVIWTALEHLRDTGTEFPAAVTDMMDKLNQEEES